MQEEALKRIKVLEGVISRTDFSGLHQHLGILCSSIQKFNMYFEQILAEVKGRSPYSDPPPSNNTEQLTEIACKISGINLADLTIRVSDLNSALQRVPMQILDNLRPKLDDMASSIQELKASCNDNQRGRGTWGPSRGQGTQPI